MLGRMILIACVMGLMQMGHASLAQEKTIDRMTREQVASFLLGMGFITEVKPIIEGKKQFVSWKINNLNGHVLMKDCDAALSNGCHTLLFFVNFNMGRPLTVDEKRRLNKFNDINVIGRAYYIATAQGEPTHIGLDMRVGLKGGVAARHLRQEIISWREVMQKFIEFMKKK